jgi:hypothetical protein
MTRAMDRCGMKGAGAGVLAAWPAMAIADRVHPDRRNGTWPPLARNPRIAVYELLAHALFGALGALVRR